MPPSQASVVQVLFDRDCERTTYNNIHIPFGTTPQQQPRPAAYSYTELPQLRGHTVTKVNISPGPLLHRHGS